MNKITDWQGGYQFIEMPYPDTSTLELVKSDPHIECPYCHNEATQFYLYHGWVCLTCHKSFFHTFTNCPSCQGRLFSGECEPCGMEFTKEDLEVNYALDPESNYHSLWG